MDECNTLAEAVVYGRRAVEVAPEQLDRPLRRAGKARKGDQKRALAGAVGAVKGDGSPSLKLQVLDTKTEIASDPLLQVPDPVQESSSLPLSSASLPFPSASLPFPSASLPFPSASLPFP